MMSETTNTSEFYALDNVPDALKARSQWVVWKLEDHGKPKLDKVPYNPRTREKAKSNDPVTWGTFAESVAAYQRGDFDGVGYVFSQTDPYVGIDLDSCRDPNTGQLEPWAAEIVERLHSYTEASPSGTGVHVLVKGSLPPSGRRKGSIEMYSEVRFFTVTGEHIGGTPTIIEERHAELASLHAEIFGTHTNGTGPASEEQAGARIGTTSLTDGEILAHARRAKNSDLFTRLWSGDWTSYPSQSEADQALCSLLAFWCSPDAARIDRLFRHSGLYRVKWDKKHFSNGQTYGQATIAKALAGCREFYRGNGHVDHSASCPPEQDWGDVQVKQESHVTENRDPWPVLSDEALHGLAGDLVRAIDPYTEADRVAVLLNVLTAFGNCINSSAHARVQHDLHPCRLFVVQVGQTSKGRKGTGWSTPRYLFSLCDFEWSKDRIKTGLSSGEGLIYNVRDPVKKREPIKEKGRVLDYEEVEVDSGESDKRLLIVEPEFASTLTVMGREGNTLSAVIRQAWDDGNLSPLTKSNPTKATNAHISILGHITKGELLRCLDDTSKANGFANRFLWVLVKRSKELPEGGAVPEEVLQPLMERLSTVITFSRTVSEVKRNDETKSLWAEIYHDLSEGKPGLVGAVLSRAEAQVLRLSVIYALLDRSAVVEVAHLRAALAVWEYCERSAVLIFGQRLGDPTADRILEALRNAGPQGMTENNIYELFGKNKSANERAQALNLLHRLALAKADKEETGGRPRTVWVAT